MATKLRILIIDDEKAICRMLSMCLQNAGYEVESADSAERGIALARRTPPDAALIDLRLGNGMDGLGAIKILAQEVPATAMIMMTAHGTIDNAVEAIKSGAVDFLVKPYTPAHVLHVIDKALSAARLRRELSEEKRMNSRHTQTIVAVDSLAMRKLMAVVSRAAATDVTLLLLGETGTGKSTLARHIHSLSARNERPFVSVHCTAISPALIESELFGHTKGAFTGADRAHAGFVEIAGNGTIFLDEIGDLPLPLQGKLLRLLEEREYVRVGDTEPRCSQARVIAATHHDLKVDVHAGRFREDLYYRLNVVSVMVPALRERREDIPLLGQGILKDLSLRHRRMPMTISFEAEQALMNYKWPGNLRELVNLLERAAILAVGDVLTPDMLPEEVTATLPPAVRTDNDDSLDGAEHRHLKDVLSRYPTLDAAARALGIDVSTLYRKRERYGLR